MIDFKNLKVIKTLSLEQGDVFFLDLSTEDVEKITSSEMKKKKPNVEKVLLDLLGASLCDESGKLLGLEEKDFRQMPRSIFQAICIFIQETISGEKKS